jgi:hypothetical protein
VVARDDADELGGGAQPVGEVGVLRARREVTAYGELRMSGVMRT